MEWRNGAGGAANEKRQAASLTQGLQQVALMVVLVEEEVVARGVRGYPAGQFGDLRGVGVDQLDRLPLRIQPLSRNKHGCWAGVCTRAFVRPIEHAGFLSAT